MVICDYDRCITDAEQIEGYYVYGWVCADWGGVYFYVGKGKGHRYKNMHNPSMSFKAIVEHWDCFPVILEQGLTEEEALSEEDRIKQVFIFESGYPIMDGEGCHSAVKNLAIKRGKDIARASGKRVDGRPEKDIPRPLLKNFLKKQKDGELTVNQCCSELGIGRTTWYKKIALLSQT